MSYRMNGLLGGDWIASLSRLVSDIAQRASPFVSHDVFPFAVRVMTRVIEREYSHDDR